MSRTHRKFDKYGEQREREQRREDDLNKKKPNRRELNRLECRQPKQDWEEWT